MTEIQSCMESFLEEIESNGMSPKQNYFYTISNVNLDGYLNLHCFISVSKYVSKDEQMLYHSYYYIDIMLSMLVQGDFEKEMGKVYAELFSYAERYKLQIASDFYQEIQKSEGAEYIFVKVATIRTL